VADAVNTKAEAKGGVSSSILKYTIQELKDEILRKISSITLRNEPLPAALEASNVSVEGNVINCSQ
jgi:hypothetical protein